MSTKKAHASTTREQFDQESSALATEFYAVLQGRTLSAGVVLEALMLLHRLETKRLPPEIRGHLSLAMAAYAGDLLHESSVHTSQTLH